MQDRPTLDELLEGLEEAGTVDLAKLSERMAKLYALPDVEAPEEPDQAAGGVTSTAWIVS